MSYQMRNSERSRKAGRFVSRVHKAIQQAVVRSGLKQQEIAKKLEMDRSAVNRRILGQSNLTLRTIADLAWALDHDIKFELVPATGKVGTNHPGPSLSLTSKETFTHSPTVSRYFSPISSTSANAVPEAAD